MNQALAKKAVESAQQYKQQKAAAALQPSMSQMGALGKPDGYMPSPGYSLTNRI
tara:strand:+ start:638 stop:799 length:162 start_codon:yes stop_codon:yes gene_type:complete